MYIYGLLSKIDIYYYYLCSCYFRSVQTFCHDQRVGTTSKWYSRNQYPTEHLSSSGGERWLFDKCVTNVDKK